MQHQLAEYHAPLLAAGQHLDVFLRVVAGKQQAPQRGAHGLIVIIRAAPISHPIGHDLVFGELVRVILRVVADFGLVRPLDGAGIGFEIARQTAQQRGLADAVRPDDGNFFTRIDAKIDVGKKHAVEALGHFLHLHRNAVQLVALVVFEADKRVLAAGRLDVFDLDLVDLPRARSGLFGLGCIGREARHEGFQLGDLFLGFRIVRRLLLACLRSGQHVLVVSAGVSSDLAVIQIGHVGTHTVQEMAIMRNNDHRASARVENVFQPADGIDVEVVGRFVQQQDVRVGKQRLRQQHAQLEARGDFAHQAVMQFDRDTHAEQ